MSRPMLNAREATGSCGSSSARVANAAANLGKAASCPVGSNTTFGPDMSMTLPRINDSNAVSRGSMSRLVHPAASAATAKSSYSARSTGADARLVINRGIARGCRANAVRYERAHALTPCSHGSSRSGRESMSAETSARTSSTMAARLGT